MQCNQLLTRLPWLLRSKHRTKAESLLKALHDHCSTNHNGRRVRWNLPTLNAGMPCFCKLCTWERHIRWPQGHIFFGQEPGDYVKVSIRSHMLLQNFVSEI